MKTKHLCNNRNYYAYSPLNLELDFKKEKNYLFDLSYLTVLSVEGSNAGSFLQGQLSNNITEVSDTKMCRAALCNLKGRVIALMDVLKLNDFKLVTPSDLKPIIENDLAKPALFSRVKFIEEDNFKIFGLYAPNENDILPVDVLPDKYNVVSSINKSIYSIGDNFYILLVKNGDYEKIFTTFDINKQLRGSLAWHFLQIKNQNVSIYPNTSGLFLPHRLNLQLKDFLSFNKGCYKGQEIIARMHYKAKTKYNLKVIEHTTDLPLDCSKKMEIDGKEIGEIINYCPISEQGKYLVLLSTRSD